MTLREQLEARRRELGWSMEDAEKRSRIEALGYAMAAGTDEPLTWKELQKLAAAMGCEIVLKVKEK